MVGSIVVVSAPVGPRTPAPGGQQELDLDLDRSGMPADIRVMDPDPMGFGGSLLAGPDLDA